MKFFFLELDILRLDVDSEKNKRMKNKPNNKLDQITQIQQKLEIRYKIWIRIKSKKSQENQKKNICFGCK